MVNPWRGERGTWGGAPGPRGVTARWVAWDGISPAAPVWVRTARRMSLRVEFSATIVSSPLLKLTWGGTPGICCSVGGGGGGPSGGGGAGCSCLTGRLRATRGWAEFARYPTGNRNSE